MSSANAVVAIGTGSVFSSVQVNASTEEAPNVQVSATALAIADQDLYTAGPLRMGTITFTAACMGAYEPVARFITGCGGELELLDNGRPTFINVACLNSGLDSCQTVTLPIELGAIFSLETSVEYSTTNTFDITTTNKVSDYFIVRELDGSQVGVALVPEPYPSALLMLGLLLTATHVLVPAASRRPPPR